MTPEERQLVADLFDRLAELEDNPRDSDAERTIKDGLSRAPHAVYALVQTVLVQDEALREADAHIQDLEAALNQGGQPQQQQGGFLDSMRDSIFGRRDEPQQPQAGARWNSGSVPSVSRGDSPMGVPPGFRSGTGEPPSGNYAAPPQQQAPQARGGSFLGTAAAAAAGMIGGSILLDGVRSALGSKAGTASASPSALGNTNETASPWGSASSSGDLSRDAGLGDIGETRTASYDNASDRGGLFDSPVGGNDDHSMMDQFADNDDDGGGFDLGDTDFS